MHELEKDDHKYLWHPFTQMQDWMLETPLIIDSGSGATLKDIHGKRYLDGVSSLWTNVHGHSKLQIDNAIKRQLRKIAHSTMLGSSSVPAIKLAKQLIELTPEKLVKVFYSDSGSTAMEIALKMAFQYWQQKDGVKFKSKQKFITLTEAYHGDTIGSVSLGGIDLFHQIFGPLLFETVSIQAPYCYRCPMGETGHCVAPFPCLKSLQDILVKQSDSIAALVIEPLMQGAAGMISQPKGYLKHIRELCTKHNVLLIVDEVATGFGRTGTMFACAQEEVQPDIMALAKGITGGYLPLAVTLTSQEVFDAFLGNHEEHKTFYHGHTYTGNQLGCAAALANLKIFNKENVLEKLQEKIELLTSELEKFKELDHVGDIRQKGFMVGIELVKNKATKEFFPIKDRVGHKVIMEARNKGVLLRPLGDVIVLMPPLSITMDELRLLLKVTYESIKIVTN